MRIAQVAPLVESIPPKLYGGTERVVSWLTEELVNAGHQVTLFASGDSTTRAELVPVCQQALRLAQQRTDSAAAHAALLDEIASRSHDYDVIHCHTEWLHLPLLARATAPFVTTLHGRLDLNGIATVLDRFSQQAFISISNNQRAPALKARWLGTVYHGLPPEALAPRFERGGYLAFLGRLSPEKGPESAIRIAKSARTPLRIAAKIPRAETSYFKDRLQPMIDGHEVELIGEVNDQAKNDFLAGAAALLFPISWPEPFGLVMIEAMACGTPVIAFRCGSVPEIMDDGVSGFVVTDEAAAADAVTRLDRLDRRCVRQCFERRFTARRMMDNYLRLYEQLALQ